VVCDDRLHPRAVGEPEQPRGRRAIQVLAVRVTGQRVGR
jgi:hypothetical protein